MGSEREMGPALTPGEWEAVRRGNVGDVLDGYVSLEDGVVDVRLGWANGTGDVQKDFYTLAALCLHVAGPHAEPLFTWEMVDAIRDALACSGTVSSPDNLPLAEHATDRIAALLPPREEP